MDRMAELDGRYEGHGLEAGGRALSGAQAHGFASTLTLNRTQTETLTSYSDC